MDTSLEDFLDSPVPTPSKKASKSSVRKCATKLCLKKNIRRSSVLLDHPPITKNSELNVEELTLSSCSDLKEITTITISDTDESVVNESSLENGDMLKDFKSKQIKKQLYRGIEDNSNEQDSKDRRKESIIKIFDGGTVYNNNELSLDNSNESNKIMSWNCSNFRKPGITRCSGLDICDKKDLNESLKYGIKNNDDALDAKLKSKSSLFPDKFMHDKNEPNYKSVEAENSEDGIRDRTNYWLNVNKKTNENDMLDTKSMDDSLDLLIENSISDTLENRIKKKLNLPNRNNKNKENSSKDNVKKKPDSRASSKENTTTNKVVQKTNVFDSSGRSTESDKSFHNSFAEKALDELYGQVWRKNKNKILTPKTAPKPRNEVKKKEKNRFPKTEVIKKKKPGKGEWRKQIEDLSSSDSDIIPIRQPRERRLIFDSNSSDDDVSPIRKPTQTRKKPSFLASLSGSVPLNECDASARIFRNTFKTNKEQLASKLFDLYNTEIFGGKIPASTPLIWSAKMRKTAGFCYCCKTMKGGVVKDRMVRIQLSSKVLTSADRLRDTLVHEMCHAATWIVNEISDGHGPFWRSWVDKAMKRFPELPPINRCHNYAIMKKYTYKCSKCGYSFGRHSKSIDIERKCCGYCHGRFELFMNRELKNGGTETVPVTKKAPTAFALYVKENYSRVKKPNLQHGDVMRILGEQFGEMKVKNLD